MKISSFILITLLGLLIVSLIVSNIIFKNQYDRIDKSDPFWNYTKLNKGNFHHISLQGGNETRISFIPSPHGSIGVLNDWEQSMSDRIETQISDDTLFVRIKQRWDPPGIRNWMKYHAIISVSCPHLLSVNVMNSKLDLYKMKEKDLSVRLAGKSQMEVESDIPDFDSIYVRQSDSSQLKFEMAEDLAGSGVMNAKLLDASVQGYSLLDIGHFKIQNLHQTLGDTAAIIFSGYTLGRIR
jgi:hypothetical protein